MSSAIAKKKQQLERLTQLGNAALDSAVAGAGCDYLDEQPKVFLPVPATPLRR
ncbi:hypothetical protein [Nostoc sp. CCY0012]|uniref:hypothetical protein n=1 Tax=Nostoc sp. CCY0012 TaxID=1056123 RepID=UPI0039C5FCD4